MVLSFLLLRGNIEFEQEDVSVVNNVIFTLLSIKTLCLDSRFVSMLLEISELHRLCANETSFEIGVNDTSSLWGLGSISDGPAFYFVCAGSEVVDELKILITGLDDSVNHGDTTQLFRLGSLNLFVVLIGSDNLRLKFSRVWDHWTTAVGFNVFLNFGQPWVLLFNILCHTNVDEVDDRLGGQEQIVIEYLDFLGVPFLIFDVLSSLKMFSDSLEGRQFLFKSLLFLGSLELCVHILNGFFKELKVFCPKFAINCLHISNWVYFTFVVGNIFVWEASDDVVDSVDCGDM